MIHNNMIKIIDMGFSKVLTGDGLTQTPLGTITTMAPQVIIKEKYGLKADIWSLGIIFYEMIFGSLPFKPAKPSEMYANIKNKDLFSNKKIRGIQPSKQCFDLLKRML